MAAALANDVTQVLSVAVDLESWPALARLTEPYPNVALSVVASIPARIVAGRQRWRS
ncbi:MAG: hypothetical protein U1F42_05100 [Candidatus Competibacteraceae bacterium]